MMLELVSWVRFLSVFQLVNKLLISACPRSRPSEDTPGTRALIRGQPDM